MEKKNLFAYLQKRFYDENVDFTKLIKVLKPKNILLFAVKQMNTYVCNTKSTLKRH